ncbi:MAG: UvrD-helicase domain-containing protein, partial [Lachnospiraceae bacterium]|nr:UvrD-helicase domain-containing protein [Lachnospiraceae bacterium]
DVLESYRNRFRYIHVDEYQDTNTAQFELVKLLAGADKNLCVVGDDDQSIYKFRGANIMNILNFEETYPTAKVIKLEQNYRSTQNILDAANAVIQNNVGRKDKALWTDKGTGTPVLTHVYATGKQEAFSIAGIVKENQQKGRRLGDHAVLYRTNAQSRALEEAFIMEGIPYKVVGGQNFYARKEIKDMLAYLKTIDNAQDDLAVKRIINVPVRGIGSTTVSRIEEYAAENGLTFYNALERCCALAIPSVAKASIKLKSFTDLIDGFRNEGEKSVKNLLSQVLEETGYKKMLEESGEEEDADRLENIQELISKAAAYESGAEEPSLSGFLQEVALVAEIDDVAEGTDRVLLMTLHSAKGLEFPCVFLAGMEEGIFPSYMAISSGDISDMEEERRLAYVGITRAEEELHLSAAKERLIHGQIQNNLPSRFLSEIPEKLQKREARPKPAPEKRTAASSGKGYLGSSPNGAKVFGKVTVVKKKEKPFQLQDLKKGSQIFSVAKPDYDVGDRVRHTNFGEGEVLELV